jgi:hypothetical protein
VTNARAHAKRRFDVRAGIPDAQRPAHVAN